MYYITLDLEWNQAYAQKALAIQRRLSCRLRGEVIQIGAVKLDKNMNICGSYQIIVKPKYYKKLHRHVSELTGITQEQMDVGTPLPEAAERFRKFCGKDFVFLTWGPDDIPMLKENFNANGMDHAWLDNTYDLQKIFNKQTDGLNKQRSLEYAMEYYEIPMNLPAHDALNDAYFTAQVAQKMDVPAGIAAYNEQKGDYLLEDVIGDADAGGDGYAEQAEAAPGEGHGSRERRKARPFRIGRLHHGREGHHREGDIGHIVEEGTQGHVLYLAAYECERKYADEIGDHSHDGDIDIGLTHGRPPRSHRRSLPASRHARGRALRQWQK